MLQGTRHRTVLNGVLVALFVAGLAVTITAQAPSSNTINACVNPAGIVRVIPPGTACLPGERPIQWNVTGPAGPAGPSGGSPVVWDSSTPDPKRVGVYAAVAPGSHLQSVLFEREGTWFFADISKDGFVKNGYGLYYANTTCSGEPYFYESGSYRYVPTNIISVSNALIGRYATGDPVPLPPPADPPGPNASVRYYEYQTEPSPCYQISVSGGAFFQVGTMDLSGFTPPFYLK